MANYLKEAKDMKEEIVQNRRTVHQFAELGLDLPKTSAFVMEKLREYGYEPQRCGKSGVTAVAGQGGKVILLRGDMDALPMKEESGLPFAATGASCHSCGHDLHTAMLLAAAKLLKEHESELKGRVKFMFQPGEEILGGAAEMIANGLLENPHVDAAIGMHTCTGHGANSKVGLITYKSEYSTFSGDYVRIVVHGLNAHGSTPEMGVDAINVAAHIVTGLEELISREVSNTERSIVLVGRIEGGDSCNTEAGTCQLDVSVRAASAERRDFLKRRVKEIAEGIAMTFRAKAEVDFVYGMPPLYNDPRMCACVPGYIREMMGEDSVKELNEYSGTEDFTAVAEKVPSIYLNIGTGNIAGDDITHHNPKIIFDEDALPIGAAVYAQCAARFLEEHQ
ncbi:MAG: M20 metallopeptidase family protein [Lachnospiraceae bacterium]|jgi:amidohydrolase